MGAKVGQRAVWLGTEKTCLRARQKCSQISEDGQDLPNVATLIICYLKVK